MLSRFGFAASKHARAANLAMQRPTMLCAVPRMTYLKDLGLDSDALVLRETEG